jgi:hypothetical protein
MISIFEAGAPSMGLRAWLRLRYVHDEADNIGVWIKVFVRAVFEALAYKRYDNKQPGGEGE